MMKIIIYALGRIFERYKDEIDWECVVALSDKSAQSSQMMNGRPIIIPEQICDIQYDYIVVFSDQLFDTIRTELTGEYFVPQEKIIPWWEIVACERQTRIILVCIDFCRKYNCRKIVDYGMKEIPRYYLTKEEIFAEQEIILDGVGIGQTAGNINLYDHIYKNISDCDDVYDAVLICETNDSVFGMLGEMKKRARYILLHTGYLIDGKAAKYYVEEKLRKYGDVSCFSVAEGLLWVIDTTVFADFFAGNMEIYVVCHKKYNSREDSLYKTLCVGGYSRQGCLTEEKGDNIAYLNGKINECTALYWIWKNTDTEYAGINHYRRYFYNNGFRSMDNCLNERQAKRILQECDMIVAGAYRNNQKTVLEYIEDSIDRELCMKVYSRIRTQISHKHPDYLRAFDSVMGGHVFFPCNMFVTRRKILNQYCEWLFSFLIEVAEKINVDGYDSYSRRVVGFFAERMLTVWLRQNQLRIKELPFVTDLQLLV